MKWYEKRSADFGASDAVTMGISDPYRSGSARRSSKNLAPSARNSAYAQSDGFPPPV